MCSPPTALECPKTHPHPRFFGDKMSFKVAVAGFSFALGGCFVATTPHSKTSSLPPPPPRPRLLLDFENDFPPPPLNTSFCIHALTTTSSIAATLTLAILSPFASTDPPRAPALTFFFFFSVVFSVFVSLTPPTSLTNHSGRWFVHSRVISGTHGQIHGRVPRLTSHPTLTAESPSPNAQ